ncbi:probable ubiquitin carboxyl-terminal hydrolase MINDY-4 isoform X1 [Amphibalanus amphitrite]|uniref:probable ubiquitin carboxyl-terminal hydrolase MINDY-4 isoform X1 n=2 Tax=Amphibalanus amphitrite TaxID=1232801 RepID=UPI001C90AAD1|nr:probable ubiquitin carboxyl-terminal hydrolase MINDY-4 isoform X1 [Amphibalanus amphitrite]
MSADSRSQLQLQPAVDSYRQRKKSDSLSGLSLRFDASFGSGAVRPLTCRYGLSRGSSQQEAPSQPPSAPSTSDSSVAKSPLGLASSSYDNWDIVRVAEHRFTRKEATGHALDDARHALSETFTFGSRQVAPAVPSLTDSWHRSPTSTSHQDTAATDGMRRATGDRKLRPTRPHGPPSAMMIRGHAVGPQVAARNPFDKQPADSGRHGAVEDGANREVLKLSQEERERQRIRATMASMRTEMMGTGATDDPSLGTRSSGLIEEAASRGARIRQSRELRITGGVQSTSDTWGPRQPAPPRRGSAMQGPPPVSSHELFARTETRAVRPAASAQPVTQSALGFDTWTVRRSSLTFGGEQQSESAPTAPQNDQRHMFGDLEIVDDDTMGELVSDFATMGGKGSVSTRSPVKGTPITEQEGCRLKELMLGSTAMSFSPEWTKQNLSFNKTENITYGIVQYKGGPCGVLAVLQAYVMKVLLFGSQLCSVPPASDAHRPSSDEQGAALTAAITEILWKCGHGEATVALSSGRSQFPGGGRYRADGITETLQLHRVSAVAPLLAYVRDQRRQFAADAGCVLLTYSAVLSRGIDSVKRDMDVATNTVIGRHGYCTQELVNLLLTGTASSNVFDGTVRLGEGADVTVLRGVDQRSEIGLLSLFEHYKSCEVGSHLKSPQLPIWVILSESHFTCLFSGDRRLCQQPPEAGRFDLFYYDMLARQDDEIRLTVEYGGDPSAELPAVRPGELVPPLEHCLRTRWPAAKVSWNGYEPIL